MFTFSFGRSIRLFPAILAISSLLAVPTRVLAEIPRTLSFQGVLTDSAGTPRANGGYTASFRLYDALTGGSILWTEASKPVAVSGGKGLFSTSLGSATAFGSLSFDKPYFLEVQMEGEAVPMTPRLPLHSVPYALGPSGSSALSLPFSGSVSTSGSAVSVTNTHGTGGSGIFVSTATGPAFSAVTANRGLSVSSTQGSYGVWAESNAGIGIFGKSNTNAAIYGQTGATQAGVAGVHGVGVSEGGHFYSSGFGSYAVFAAAPEGVGVRSVSGHRAIWAISTGSSFGVDAESNMGTGVRGKSNSGYGVQGESAGVAIFGLSSGSIGVYGESRATSGSGGHGVFGKARGPGLAGVFGENNVAGGWGVIGSGMGAGANGVRGESQSGNGVLATSASNDGVLGYSAGTGKAGVAGVSNGPGGGNGLYGRSDNAGYGVWGTTSSAGGKGVHGEATSGAYGELGSYSTRWKGLGYHVGVLAFAPPNGPGTGILGVAGEFGWAGSFAGGVQISSSLFVDGTKDFRIDHPLDPKNRYLHHSAAEGPEPLNVYSGNITTDAAGEAVVTLPAYFEAINRDFRYQLTVLDAERFAQARVSSKISGNRFTIKTDRPQVEVSWQVTGVRNDAWMKAHPAEVEPMKPPEERGRYSHPELYAAPPSAEAPPA